MREQRLGAQQDTIFRISGIQGGFTKIGLGHGGCTIEGEDAFRNLDDHAAVV